MFLAKLNGGLETWSTNISNAYHEAKAKEVYIIDGPEFGKLEGYTLIISTDSTVLVLDGMSVLMTVFAT
jgi:hypothetical protein